MMDTEKSRGRGKGKGRGRGRGRGRKNGAETIQPAKGIYE